MKTPVDPSDFKTDRILKNLQGNILKGHGRDHTTHLFIKFKPTPEKIKEATKWIREFAEEQVTSLKKQLEERDLFKTEKIPGGLFSSFFLTASGYRALGYEDVESKLADEAFLAGMKQRRKMLEDPDSENWETGFTEEHHALILLADDDTNRMGTFATALLKELEPFCVINAIEYGHVIRNKNKDGIEHFGYVDGVSQPLFLKDEIEDYNKLHNINANNPLKFNPAADVELVLLKDPYADQNVDKPSYGSYFVFRKLEQNVREFKKAEEAVGEKLFPDHQDKSKREIAGAYIVGRFEDGSPVVLDDEDGIPNSGKFNNFDYSDDPSGGRCPHFAHIRKTNPRADFTGAEDHKSHIMARRGIPFGHREVDTAIDPSPEQSPTGGVGLLFMSYQKSLTNQFEFIQIKWANNPTFPKHVDPSETGVDLIIGQPHQHPAGNYKFPLPYGTTTKKPASMDQFVTMKGGEYFFAPSITFLKTIECPTLNQPAI